MSLLIHRDFRHNDSGPLSRSSKAEKLNHDQVVMLELRVWGQLTSQLRLTIEFS